MGYPLFINHNLIMTNKQKPGSLFYNINNRLADIQNSAITATPISVSFDVMCFMFYSICCWWMI